MAVLAAAVASAQSTQPMVGDVNGDGAINVLDVQASVAQALQVIPQTALADVDGSNQVDITDVQNLVNTALGTGGLVQRVRGGLTAAADLLSNGIQLVAVSQDSYRMTPVDPVTGAFAITLPVREEWSFLFVTEPDGSGQQQVSTVQFPIAETTSTVLPLPDLSQCDVLDLGTLAFAPQTTASRDIRELLGGINNQDLLLDSDDNGIPDFIQLLLVQVTSISSIGCGSAGKLPGIPCLDLATLAALIGPCLDTHLTEITNLSLADDDHDGLPDFEEPLLQCLHDTIATWIRETGIPLPIEPLMSAVMASIQQLLPVWIAELNRPGLVDSHGDGIPDHLRGLVGSPGLPSWADVDQDGIPDCADHRHGGEGEGEGEGEIVS